MKKLTRVVETFPSIQIPGEENSLPIEVSLIAQLGHGAGNKLFANVSSRQKGHENFIEQLDEPSAKLADINLSLNDSSALYSFSVGAKGHPFHRHAGNRFFTAVSGSGGAQLRFSTASLEKITEEPTLFLESLHFINIPADCLFTVRFGGGTWHQFLPLSRNSVHPAFFALSYHANELEGDLSESLKQKILDNKGSIPALTELLPANVNALIQTPDFQTCIVPTTALSLDAPAGTLHRAVCDTARCGAGILQNFFTTWGSTSGFISEAKLTRKTQELGSPPKTSLLRNHLKSLPVHHEDTFVLSLTGQNFDQLDSSQLLASVLEGFLLNAPTGVSKLMLLRNVLVKPIGLRTSPLGCPVSSLLSDQTDNLFANQYPVLDQAIDGSGRLAQVVLGADDKHLNFRACVGVEIIDDSHIEVALGNRVHCKNWFGRFYMSAIDYVHRHYIAPNMLRRAVDYMVFQDKLSVK